MSAEREPPDATELTAEDVAQAKKPVSDKKLEAARVARLVKATVARKEEERQRREKFHQDVQTVLQEMDRERARSDGEPSKQAPRKKKAPAAAPKKEPKVLSESDDEPDSEEVSEPSESESYHRAKSRGRKSSSHEKYLVAEPASRKASSSKSAKKRAKHRGESDDDEESSDEDDVPEPHASYPGSQRYWQPPPQRAPVSGVPPMSDYRSALEAAKMWGIL